MLNFRDRTPKRTGRWAIELHLTDLPTLVFCYICGYYNAVLHTYHLRFIPEGVAEAQIFLRDAHVLLKLLSYEEHCRRDRWLAHRRVIAVSVR
jgi:hypothetical protein